MCVCVHVSVSTCVTVCGGQKPTLGINQSLPSASFEIQLSFHYCTAQATCPDDRRTLLSPRSIFHSEHKVLDRYPCIWPSVGSGDPNSGLHTCALYSLSHLYWSGVTKCLKKETSSTWHCLPEWSDWIVLFTARLQFKQDFQSLGL